jgi:hypothetical protein
MSDIDRPAPGELIVISPECPLCGKETEVDEGFTCWPCGAYWSRIDSPGEWVEPDDPRCCVSLIHAGHPILSGQCVKSEGHGGEHNNGDTSWPDGMSSYHRIVGCTEVEVVS